MKDFMTFRNNEYFFLFLATKVTGFQKPEDLLWIRLWAMEALKILGTEVSYFTMLYELTQNKCFLSPFSEGGQNFVYGIISPVQFIFVDRLFIFLMVEELFFSNQENPYVMFN